MNNLQDILIRLQNLPKINGAHPKDIEDAIKEITWLRVENADLKEACRIYARALKEINELPIPYPYSI